MDPNFAMIYNNLGLLYLHNKKDNIKAEEYYKKSISLNQKIPEPYNNLASLYKSLDKFDEAIDCYNSAITINPKFFLSLTTTFKTKTQNHNLPQKIPKKTSPKK